MGNTGHASEEKAFLKQVLQCECGQIYCENDTPDFCRRCGKRLVISFKILDPAKIRPKNKALKRHLNNRCEKCGGNIENNICEKCGACGE